MKEVARYHRPYRVRLFSSSIPVRETIDLHANEIYWRMANKFKETPQYSWVEDNDIKIDWEYNDTELAWARQCMFYADLTDSEYIDYCLRFFDHHNEAWK